MLKVKKMSQKQEKEIAKELGGRVQIASGAFDDKGDVSTDKFLVECKITRYGYYNLNVTTWNKIRKEAYNVGKCPLLIIELRDYMNRPDRLVILRHDDFDYYNIKSDLHVQLPNTMSFFRSTRIREYNSHTILKSKNITYEEELVIMRWDIFKAMIMEE